MESRAKPEEILQLLDEHHLVVLSDGTARRDRFVRAMHGHLQTMSGVEVLLVNGRSATDLSAFCRELSRSLPSRATIPSEIPSVIRALRDWPTAPRYRYILWRDADAMLEADVELFSRLVNVLCAVAAEFEHLGASGDTSPLVLQRSMFIGTSKLGAYAEDHRGQFCQWLDDADDEQSVFWEVMSCVDAPPVLTYRLDG